MKHLWRTITYDRDGECWVMHIDGATYGLHCGECMGIRIGDRTVPCRIELDHDWYIIMPEAQFYLRKKDSYQVEI